MRFILLLVSLFILPCISWGAIATGNITTCSANGTAQEQRDIVVMYVNGITNTEDEALSSRVELSSAFWQDNNLRTTYRGKVKFINVYNPTNGLIDDVDELSTQAGYQAQALETAQKKANKYFAAWSRRHNGNQLPASTKAAIQNGYFNRELRRLVIDDMYANAAAGNPRQSLEEEVGDIAAKISTAIKERVFNGSRVVVVAHSQGNYMIQEANALLRGELTSDLLASIQYVGVANVARTSPSNRYVTMKQDEAVYWYHSKQSNAAPAPSNFDARLKNADETINNDASALEDIDDRVHNFINIYLNDKIVNIAGNEMESARHTVLRMVGDAIANAAQPQESLFSLGPISATLGWTGSSDIDLHIIEPDLAEVFWGHLIGTVGYLDLDDTDGIGPEHYYTKCDKLIAGNYTFSVNPYHLTGQEMATVNLQISGRILSRQVRFDTGTAKQMMFKVNLAKNNSTGLWTYSVD